MAHSPELLIRIIPLSLIAAVSAAVGVDAYGTYTTLATVAWCVASVAGLLCAQNVVAGFRYGRELRRSRGHVKRAPVESHEVEGFPSWELAPARGIFGNLSRKFLLKEPTTERSYRRLLAAGQAPRRPQEPDGNDRSSSPQPADDQ